MNRNWKKRTFFLAALVAGVALYMAVPLGARYVKAQGLPPPGPATFAGSVRVEGSPAPDGLEIRARIGDTYISQPTFTEGGRYPFIKVSPLNDQFLGQDITFHLDGIQADETVAYRPNYVDLNFNLTFPEFPPPTPTPEPVYVSPAVYSGRLVVAGSTVPEDAVLVGRIGTYESTPAVIEGDSYSNLVVAPSDESVVGQAVKFYLNDIESEPPNRSPAFKPGDFKTIDLIFVGLPEPTPTPTETPLPPTPTATVIPTATATPTPESTGGCREGAGDTPVATGLGNLAFVLAPLALLGGYKIRRRRR